MRRLSDDEYRHRCEVRYVLAWMRRDARGARQYLAQVGRLSPRATWLAQECAVQWTKGNRGRWGDWR